MTKAIVMIRTTVFSSWPMAGLTHTNDMKTKEKLDRFYLETLYEEDDIRGKKW